MQNVIKVVSGKGYHLFISYLVYSQVLSFLYAINLLACHLLLFSTESYYGDSYCSLQVFQDVSNFHLSMQIKTSRRSGLLLLAAGMEDYLFLELQNGRVQVSGSHLFFIFFCHETWNKLLKHINVI